MSIELAYGSGAIALPARALDTNAGLIELRVLMLLCADPHAAQAYPEGIEDLARAVGAQVGAVREAVAFWSGTGILTCSVAQTPPKRQIKVDRALIKDTVPDYSGEALAAMVDENTALKALIEECQQILGKMLSRTEIEKLAALWDYLRLEKEYILLLTQYCVSMNKRSVAYIVKTAYGLFNDGIDDYPKLDAHIKRRERYHSVIGRLRAMLGIGERELTKKENAYVNQWVEEYALPLEVIRMAYEGTIAAIKEVSFDYMGKILTSWYQAGAVTVEGVQALQEDYKARREAEKKAAGTASTFDTQDFFEAALRRSEELLGD